MNVVKHLQAIRREVQDGERKRVLFVASTASPDRYEDIVDQATWKLDNYRANPVVQADHVYSVRDTVARGIVEVGADGLTLEIEKWSRKASAQELAQDVEDGIINAVSVGFRPGRMVARGAMPPEDPRFGERGYVHFDCELLEVSIVAIPANPEALAAKSLDASLVDAVVERVAARLLASPSFLAREDSGSLAHLFPGGEADSLASLFPQE